MVNDKLSGRLIFITGGVVSSLGKGIAVASLATLLQSRGYKVAMKKLDPYLNVDPGTMSPFQHGEVFVTEDGAETDLDLGHYERFTGINAKRTDNITTGQLYSTLLKRERNGNYLGGTVQVIPHVTDLIKEFIKSDISDFDFTLCEIGGTVGDIEGLPYFETIRQIGNELGGEKVIFIHLTLVPYINVAQELKTKPTQHSVRELRSIGIQPNIIMCRADRKIPDKELRKIALFSNLPQDFIIQAIDCNSIYKIPINYHHAGLDDAVLRAFGLLSKSKSPNLEKWYDIIERIENPKHNVVIALVGKYNSLKDAYKSLLQALEHAGIHHRCNVTVKWIDTEILELTENLNFHSIFSGINAIIVPGGFGDRGIERKIDAIKYARENNIPFLGICLGMQLLLIEYARNVIGVSDANSTEFSHKCTPIVALIDEWQRDNGIVVKKAEDGKIGGTMRLGAYNCRLMQGSLAYKLYGERDHISERHRHRYEFNLHYKELFSNYPIVFSGLSSYEDLVEIVELPNLNFFIATQFHPEFKSKPTEAHPIFIGFIEAAIRHIAK